MRVKALTRGYYADRIVEDGQVFTLKDPAHLSPWMEPLDGVPAKAKASRSAKKKTAEEAPTSFAD